MNDNNSKTQYGVDFLEKKLEFFSKNTVMSVFIIMIISFILRLYYLPSDIPLTLDALLYFWYAIDTSILGHFPTSYAVENNGWPAFVSLFFSIFHYDNFMGYMLLQRLASMSISVLTIIPVYLLCNRFFDKPYALLGAAIFAFEPRIIQNSLLGIADPLYLLLLATSLFLFQSSNKKLMCASFGTASLATLVRYEGMFLFLALSIIFFIRYRKERQIIAKYVLAATIFVLILLPMTIIRIEITGQDSLSSNIQSAPTEIISQSENVGLVPFLMTGLVNLVKFLGWAMIPVFIFFAPIGFLLILKNRNSNTVSIIIIIVVMLMPALYAFTVRAFDTRYLFSIYPILCVLSIFTVRSFTERFHNRNTILILLVGGILLSSSLFLDLKKVDAEHEKEALSLAYHIVNRTKVINQYLPESKYIVITAMTDLQKFPVLRSDFKGEPIAILDLKAESAEEYIQLGREMGLTHLIVDQIENLRRPYFLEDIFNHDENYPYLIKEFDSLDYGYKYHLKIYKIDYGKFDYTINKVTTDTAHK